MSPLARPRKPLTPSCGIPATISLARKIRAIILRNFVRSYRCCAPEAPFLSEGTLKPEQVHETKLCLHTDRAACRHRHHRNPCRDAVAGIIEGQNQGAGYSVPKQPSPVGLGLDTLRRR